MASDTTRSARHAPGLFAARRLAKRSAPRSSEPAAALSRERPVASAESGCASTADRTRRSRDARPRDEAESRRLVPLPPASDTNPSARATSLDGTRQVAGAGRVLGGKYRLLRPLARGAMGSIWRAEHLELGCEVALKLSDDPGSAEGESSARFVREARTAAALRSPHVVQVLDYGVDQETQYLVMELLHGETLLQRLARVGRLSKRETALILSQVANALGRAHVLGVAHRDLSASNVFLVADAGQPLAKLLDFGIAKYKESSLPTEQNLTLRGMILGTPRYMSPEQAQGTSVDFRTDIWAFGVLAFECLLGFPPFEARTFGSLVLAICSNKLPVPSKLGDVPAAFDGWFARTCARDPAARFASACEAAQALRRVLRSRLRGVRA